MQTYIVEFGSEIKLITSDLQQAVEEFQLWADHSVQAETAEKAVLKADIWENASPRS